jgi:serine protease Do
MPPRICSVPLTGLPLTRLLMTRPLMTRRLMMGLLVAGLLLMSFAGAARADDPSADSDQVGSASEQTGPRALSRAFRSAARRATPAVVTILSYGQDDFLRNLIARQQQQDSDGEETETPEPDENQLTGLGSGVIVSEDGRVITNNHVIAGAKRVVVQLFDETEIEATEVRGDSDSDVATLKIQREGGFDSIEMGDSDSLEIGDWVLAIGSPFRLEATVSAGIISAKNRALRRIRRGRLIQTDAAINPGNSGGPLIDLDGRVIAISTAIATRNGGYQGVGFAIPINQARWIADELAAHGMVRRAAIGVRMAELNPRIATKFNLPAGMGVLAYQVIEDSAADRAGIRPLDVIMEFAGERVRDPGALQEVVERLPVGSIQEVKVYRDGKVETLAVELATVEDPTAGSEEADDSNDESNANPESPQDALGRDPAED